MISNVTRHERHFRASMEQRPKLSADKAIKVRRKRLVKDGKQLEELDRLSVRLYEDNVAERISGERFSMMSGCYEAEQTTLKAKTPTLQREIRQQEQQLDVLDLFARRVRDHVEWKDLTPHAFGSLRKPSPRVKPAANGGRASASPAI